MNWIKPLNINGLSLFKYFFVWKKHGNTIISNGRENMQNYPFLSKKKIIILDISEWNHNLNDKYRFGSKFMILNKKNARTFLLEFDG